jgi:hypothetical protein
MAICWTWYSFDCKSFIRVQVSLKLLYYKSTFGLEWCIRWIILYTVFFDTINIEPPPYHTLRASQGHFTHEPRSMTMKLWEPKRKCPKAVPRYLQNHVVLLWTLKCTVKSYVARPSIKCYFNEFLFMLVLTHDKIKTYQRLWAFGVPWSPGVVLDLLPRGDLWK